MSFQDKVAWITGASSGIGEALAYALHDRGAKLILSSRRKNILEEVKEQCPGDPADVTILPLDLSETDKLPDKAQQALNIYGHIDYLFNNGGVSQRSKAINTDVDVMKRVLDINFLGSAVLAKEVLPSMIERKSGHIIVTSSVVGKFGTQLRSSYAASKHALHGYFDSLRQEVFNKNISISLVCPGFIKTNVTKNALEGNGEKHQKMGKGQQNGMTPAQFAEKLLPKIAKGKEEIYIGGMEIMGIYFQRFVPSLFHKILRKIDVT
ncbi:Short-chain dehydrogenase [Fodinibius salinus]|uniref:Short-chain dehydrogenase n=1 Tax=Fodinibius salinus TaxID=860790 RepID=A0A5D3YMH0_9BACT|nr:SDR family oxidoreductase [Fodinibius salinus]TYP93319.1 Short-chain dehydrogenase [Fodinibius salinus]